MLREGSSFDHFRNGKTGHLLSFDKTYNILRFNAHIILISFSIQPHYTIAKGVRRFVSYREEYLRRRNRVKRVANFNEIIRILKQPIFHIIFQLFSGTLSFLRERVWKIYLFIERTKKKQDEAKSERDGKRNCGAWVTNIKWGSRKAFLSKQFSFLPLKLPKLKLAFLLSLVSLLLRQKIFLTKIKKEKKNTKVCSRFSFLFQFFSSKWIIFLLFFLFIRCYVWNFSTSAPTRNVCNHLENFKMLRKQINKLYHGVEAFGDCLVPLSAEQCEGEQNKKSNSKKEKRRGYQI